MRCTRRSIMVLSAAVCFLQQYMVVSLGLPVAPIRRWPGGGSYFPSSVSSSPAFHSRARSSIVDEVVDGEERRQGRSHRRRSARAGWRRSKSVRGGEDEVGSEERRQGRSPRRRSARAGRRSAALSGGDDEDESDSEERREGRFQRRTRRAGRAARRRARRSARGEPALGGAGDDEEAPPPAPPPTPAARDNLREIWVVTFHVGPLEDGADTRLGAMASSARHYFPGCRLVLLSDRRASELPELGRDAEVRRVATSGNRTLLMRERMEAEAALLRGLVSARDAGSAASRKQWGRAYDPASWASFTGGRRLLGPASSSVRARGLDPHVIFVDSDVLFSRNFAELFLENFAVALTYRNHDEMPINMGVKIVHGAHIDEAAALWGQFLVSFDRVRQCFSCDQRAVAHAIKAGKAASSGRLRDITRGTRATNVVVACDHPGRAKQVHVRLRLLHCSAYNVVPGSKNLDCAPRGDGSGMTFVHFKGKKKYEIAEYWEMLSGEGGREKVVKMLKQSKKTDAASVRRERAREEAGMAGRSGSGEEGEA